MKQFKSLLLVVSLLFSSVSSASLMLWFDPDFQLGATGDSVSVTLMASGLETVDTPSLGAFDLDVLFDPGVLSLTGYTLFDGLGSLAAFDAIDISLGEYAPGTLGLGVISLLSDIELAAAQPASFALAEIFFDVDLLASPDFTVLSIAPNPAPFAFATGDGSSIDVQDISLRTGVISTVPRTIPEPSVIILIALGLMLVASKRLRMK